jgi:RHS repeat-associated protein
MSPAQHDASDCNERSRTRGRPPPLQLTRRRAPLAGLPQSRADRARRSATWSTGAVEHDFGGDRAPGGNVVLRLAYATDRPRTRECPRRTVPPSARGNPSLGSAETISTSSGQSFEQRFDPFGAPDPTNATITRAGYTGHAHDNDNDLGLIDMRGRVYDPLAARFTTADPIMQAPHWSQGMNRYAYVFNDPLNATDPSGFISMSDVVKGFVYGGHIVSAGLLAGGSITSGNAATTNFAAVGGPTGGSSVTTMPGLLQGQPGSGPSVVEMPQVQEGDSTASGAAFRALRDVVPRSARENNEYGGVIYRLNGRYHATPAVTSGSEGAVEVWDALKDVPSGAQVVGDYHTHPSTIEGEPRWWKNGEMFSGTELPYIPKPYREMLSQSVIDASDYFGAKLDLSREGVNIDKNAFTSYVSTPSGRFGVYNVQSDRIFYFSPSSQLLPPGQAVPASSYSYH